MRVVRLFKACIYIVVAQLIVLVRHKYYEDKCIWIFSEKKTEARDNGYHFFRYIKENHPYINAYYIITCDSPDKEKVEKIGPIITYDSFKHCLFFFAAKERVCSQIHGVRPFEELSGLTRLYFYRLDGQKSINLKHGISKDYRPSTFDFRKVGFDLYISGAKPEYDYIKTTFNYPEKNIVLSGFCRFDTLQHCERPQKIVLIMPTFRSWLRTSDSSKKQSSNDETRFFKESNFYKAYIQLLNNGEFKEVCSRSGYKVIFYLHYTLQPYSWVFKESIDASTNMIIANRDKYDVQDLLMKSAVLITDYSSVFFDFAYMHKPTIYYQFDKKEYRAKHYKEGFFIYEEHGFGPVFENEGETVQYLGKIIANNCEVEQQYLNRINTFFQPYDDHNCERVYNAILRLE